MDKVSRVIKSEIKGKSGIESEYFNVEYRPGLSTHNSKLLSHTSSIVSYMAFADISRNKREIGKLNEYFLLSLSSCKTDVDIEEFRKFMQELASKGGYAKEFYDEKIGLINKENIENASKELERINEEKRKPVSKLVEGGFTSEYFNLCYRPHGGLDRIDISCSSILTYMAMADITREERQINNLNMKFYKTLLMCQTQKDFENFNTFMRLASTEGGYAMDFYDQVKGLINENGKVKASEYIKNMEKQMKPNKSELSNFKIEFEELNSDFERFRNVGVKSDDDAAYFLRKYNELQSKLYRFDGVVGREVISKFDEQIEDSIDYLKGLYKLFDSYKNF